jgi:peptidoglycan/LPS O-acetylase OafA/YrhL
MKYRPEIDGLRAVAVISVILNHLNKNLLPCGYLGVDIFFVISGYVITGSLYKTSDKTFADFFLGFYSRRVKRLIPALVLCVLITGVLVCLFDANPGVSLRTGIAALFGLSNLYLLSQATDYFGTSAELNVFTQTWSLGVEEQFYVLFPFIVWLTGFARRHRRGSTNLCLAIGLLAVFSLIIFLRRSVVHNPSAFFLLPARFWELSAGCLAFVALNSARTFASPLLTKVSSSGVMLGLIAALFIPSEFAMYGTLCVVLLTALLITSIHPETVAYKLLVHPAAIYVGRISYSLYLWHWSVISISRWTIGVHLWSAPLQFGLMLLLADVSFRYVEHPMRRVEWSPIRWRSFCYGLVASAVVAIVLTVLAIPLDGRLYTGKRPKLAAAGIFSLTEIYKMPDGLSSWQGEKCVLSNNNQVGKIIQIDKCTLGDFMSAGHRILVLGNSFSAAFIQAFDQLVLSDTDSVTITSSWNASPVPEVPSDNSWADATNYYWDTIVPSLVSHLREGDWVFLVDDLATFSPERPSRSSDRLLTQLRLGLAKFSAQLSEHGVGLAVLDGLPFAREADCKPAMATPQWFRPFGSSCHFISKERTLSRRANLDETLSALKNQGSISIVDLIEIFCPREICTYEGANGQMLYRDELSHPSIEAARLSAPIIRDALTARMSFVAPERPNTVIGLDDQQ